MKRCMKCGGVKTADISPNQVKFTKADRDGPMAESDILVNGKEIGTMTMWYFEEVYDKRLMDLSAEVEIDGMVHDFYITIRNKAKKLVNSPSSAKNRVKKWVATLYNTPKEERDLV